MHGASPDLRRLALHKLALECLGLYVALLLVLPVSSACVDVPPWDYMPPTCCHGWTSRAPCRHLLESLCSQNPRRSRCRRADANAHCSPRWEQVVPEQTEVIEGRGRPR